ncbi:hypothetical protein HHK36_013527 [Tetracentron sinense]|uniref:Cation-transporting P-type ATPase N-terminal domain-containing protein n=1 Tax=Tetracentron sinense TaxID=13715 RepID=A0A834Z6G4_TETSI|nr:hypothetical protein HHK36_013527 [Tetracentron sinense]
MKSVSNESPYDLEGGIGEFEDDELPSGPFDFTTTKNVSLERLRRWRVGSGKDKEVKVTMVLNASRRFRYTLDLKKEEEIEQIRRKIRAHSQLIRHISSKRTGNDQMVNGLSDFLKTNLENGISGGDADLLKRRNAFGSNTYPRKKGRSFWMFLWEAFQDLTLIILMVAAAVSLALGIKKQVEKVIKFPETQRLQLLPKIVPYHCLIFLLPEGGVAGESSGSCIVAEA